MLEDIGNTSNMMNMLKAIPTWQQKNNQNWSPDAAYVQQLTCDSHHQPPWSPTYWNTDMTSQQSNRMNVNMMNGNMMTNTGGNMMYTNALTNTMMNTIMMNSDVITNNSGYNNNEGYSCYEDYSP